MRMLLLEHTFAFMNGRYRLEPEGHGRSQKQQVSGVEAPHDQSRVETISRSRLSVMDIDGWEA